jgi:hypothetical protein
MLYVRLAILAILGLFFLSPGAEKMEVNYADESDFAEVTPEKAPAVADQSVSIPLSKSETR